jgi:Flp pilus assembly protein TadG
MPSLRRAQHNPAHKVRRRAKAQSLVEFAFAIPFLLLCVIGIVYFGRVFFTAQVLAYAAQEGARQAASIPNLDSTDVRDAVRGFSSSGTESNQSSVIYRAMGAAHLLSQGTTGNLPPGAKVKILLPNGGGDSDGSAEDFVPPGTVAVRVEYPFSLLIDPFTGQPHGQTTSVSIALTADPANPPVPFADIKLSEKAVVAQQVYSGG